MRVERMERNTETVNRNEPRRYAEKQYSGFKGVEEEGKQEDGK